MCTLASMIESLFPINYCVRSHSTVWPVPVCTTYGAAVQRESLRLLRLSHDIRLDYHSAQIKSVRLGTPDDRLCGHRDTGQQPSSEL